MLKVVDCFMLPDVPVTVMVEVFELAIGGRLIPQLTTHTSEPSNSARRSADALRRLPGTAMTAMPTRPSPVIGSHAASRFPDCDMAAEDGVVLTVKTISFSTLPAGIVEGKNEHVAPVGKPEHARVMAAAIPGFGVKVMCSVAGGPARVLTEGSVAAKPKPGLSTVTVAVACAVAPLESLAVSFTLVLPMAYGPGGACVSVTESPSGSCEPLSTSAAAVPPLFAAITVTSCAIANGAWLGGLFTITSAVVCAVAPFVSTTVSITLVIPIP